VTASGQAILLVEDDIGLQKQMRWSLSDYQLLVADDAKSALTLFRRETPRVAIVDLGLPPLPDDATEGLKLIEAILTLEPATKIIVASGNQDRENAVKAIGLGAYDFFAKPIDADMLLLMINRAFRLSELEHENRKLQRATHRSPFDGVVASSPRMLEVCKLVERVAPSNVSVLLLGESGTGKELLARALHTLNPRSANKFVAINCAAIPDTLLESELFGYERGAFTGATRQTAGMIEHAHGGTLFLDEIADMPLALQAKLLRFLQERTIVRLGGRDPIEVDTRIVSATNRNLAQAISQGQFREDLYYRLGEVSVEIPPLREREDDAVLIARSILDRLTEKSAPPEKKLSEDAIRAIASYTWPGNVRELESRLKRATLLTDGQFITAAALGLADSKERQSFPTLRQARAEAEIDMIRRALALSDYNISQAAKLLGVSRPTLYDIMATHDFKLDRTGAGGKREEKTVVES
jgi:two-component system, NtrC family, response regulator